ncbi:hypothetical protein Kpho01_09220 [Kitasatospora phosalacinea]|uniref:Uncharacterized protein n=2 Tax=Kitasatospora phosalacinea TaxID=2065 RepID=A0A9W6PD49_9ACTN|nr:hypothetical protein Kpho01_09220 [Kitasatospora phosalacinea]
MPAEKPSAHGDHLGPLATVVTMSDSQPHEVVAQPRTAAGVLFIDEDDRVHAAYTARTQSETVYLEHGATRS